MRLTSRVDAGTRTQEPLGGRAWPVARRSAGAWTHTIIPDLEAAWLEHGDAFRIPIADVMKPVFAAPHAVQQILSAHADERQQPGPFDESVAERVLHATVCQSSAHFAALARRAAGGVLEIDLHRELSELAADVVRDVIAGSPSPVPEQLFDIYEAVASSMPWLFAFLEERPDLLARLQCQALETQQPTLLDPMRLANLELVQRLVDETLRLRAPSMFVTRRAVCDDVVDGYRIGAGETVLLFIAAARRHPTFWPDADTFRPERWSTVDPEARKALLCTHDDGGLASLAMTAILLALVQRFQVLTMPYRGVLEAPVSMLRPTRPVRVVLRARYAVSRREAFC